MRAIRASAKGKADTAASLEKQAKDAKQHVERQKERAQEMEEQLQQLYVENQVMTREML